MKVVGLGHSRPHRRYRLHEQRIRQKASARNTRSPTWLLEPKDFACLLLDEVPHVDFVRLPRDVQFSATAQKWHTERDRRRSFAYVSVLQEESCMCLYIASEILTDGVAECTLVRSSIFYSDTTCCA